MLSLIHDLPTELPLSSDRRTIRPYPGTRDPVSVSQCFHVQSGPQELINLLTIPSLTTQRCAGIGKRKGKPQVAIQHPYGLSPGEWEHCGAAQTNRGLCANKGSQRSPEVKEQEHRLVDRRRSTSITLTSITLTSHRHSPFSKMRRPEDSCDDSPDQSEWPLESRVQEPLWQQLHQGLCQGKETEPDENVARCYAELGFLSDWLWSWEPDKQELDS
ncbi:hypothetical protein NQZ68_007109 [Dissostichus eleginoides]|nr:hypothetical protein NQZ68_007109 [Dissostichus eleginoides]